MLLVHSEIYYVAIGGGWEEGLVRNVLHYIPPAPSTSTWTQTLSLPPPGIEPGSPESQVGTLPKELSGQLVMIRNVLHYIPVLHPGHKHKFASTGNRTGVVCITGGHST